MAAHSRGKVSQGMNQTRLIPDCCSADRVEPLGAAAGKCPKCNRPGKPIGSITLKHMVNPAFLELVAPPGFLFCASLSCDVVYFNPDGQELRRNDLRIPVGAKGAEDAPLCYCFGFTQKMVERANRGGNEGGELRLRGAQSSGLLLPRPGCLCSQRLEVWRTEFDDVWIAPFGPIFRNPK